MNIKILFRKFLHQISYYEYYEYNTFPLRFFKSQTCTKEIIHNFLYDGVTLFLITYQICYFYKIQDSLFIYLFVPWLVYYLFGIIRFLSKKIVSY